MMRMAGPPSIFSTRPGRSCQRADRGLRIRPRHPREHADRGLRRAAGGQQARSNRRRRGHAHIDDDRHLRVGQRRPVDGFGVPRLVRGQKGDAQRFMAEGQRHLELRGGAKACGNSRHDRIGDAGRAQRFDFLAAAAEDEGIAALQPHRALAGFRGFDQQFVDGVLADAGLADAAADRHARRIAARAVENFRRDQFVVEHDVGVLQRAQRLDGQQDPDRRGRRRPASRCPRPCPMLARRRRRTGRQSASARLRPRPCGRREPARRSGHRPRAPRSGGAARNSGMRPWIDLRQRPMKPARSPIRAGSTASMRSRTRRATTGEAPPVPTATTTSPRSTMAGKMKVECARSSITLTGKADRLGPRRHRNADVAGAGAQDRDHAARDQRSADRPCASSIRAASSAASPLRS